MMTSDREASLEELEADVRRLSPMVIVECHKTMADLDSVPAHLLTPRLRVIRQNAEELAQQLEELLAMADWSSDVEE